MSNGEKKAAVKVPHCKDCGSTSRALPHPGPRCATCWRAVKVARKDAAFDRYLRRTYNITAADYWAMYERQGKACAWCQRANGRTKRLAVDHDHACCPGPRSCGACVRGLLCGPCNQHVGYVGDSPAAMARMVGYLSRTRQADMVVVAAQRPRTALHVASEG